MASWSENRSGRGGSLVRVSGASGAATGADAAASGVTEEVETGTNALPTPALPGQVRSVGGPVTAAANPGPEHSALSAHHMA